ncbi:serine hydrolase [Oceanicoccus sp. KOV_DT_Chl]|uniref:serine hydrolase domain-containing protein n=1 Tax=Oceanicoccus sp. KOV_DT_Chl TaxID=1904639 RepID=UPI000C7CBA3B|nr:serine hydrolase [Oceanicoccus sp. KOV_DT_Chl]
MHKTVVALLVGVAIADGAIGSVDDKVVRYFPEWAADSRGAITIRDLLTMSSGLEQYPFSLNPFAGKSAFRFLFAGDRERVALTTVQRWQPQATYDYNDINAQLLGLLLERATGMRYRDYLQEKLWQPMGGQAAQVWLDHEQGLAMTACCLLAPAQDWARIGLLMKNGGELNGKQIIPRDWITAMLTPSTLNSSYGYFTWLGKDLKAFADQKIADKPGAYEYWQSEAFAVDDLFYCWAIAGSGFMSPLNMIW